MLDVGAIDVPGSGSCDVGEAGELLVQVAAQDTIAASDIGNWSEDLVVRGLNGPDDYRRCLNYLQRISIVEEVAVVSARPGAVTFRLGLSALPDYLQRSLDSGGVLERSEFGDAYELVRAISDDG